MEPQSACGDHSQVAPAFAANTGSGCGSGLEVEVGKEFIQKRFTLEDGKIATDFRHVHGSGIGTQQGPNIVQVTQAPGVVDIALQLEAHQTLYTHYAKPPHPGIPILRSHQQSTGLGPVRIEQVKTLITAQVVGRILTAMYAAVSQPQKQFMQAIRVC